MEAKENEIFLDQEFEIFCVEQNEAYYTSKRDEAEVQAWIDDNFAPSCKGPHLIRKVHRVTSQEPSN